MKYKLKLLLTNIDFWLVNTTTLKHTYLLLNRYLLNYRSLQLNSATFTPKYYLSWKPLNRLSLKKNSLIKCLTPLYTGHITLKRQNFSTPKSLYMYYAYNPTVRLDPLSIKRGNVFTVLIHTINCLKFTYTFLWLQTYYYFKYLLCNFKVFNQFSTKFNKINTLKRYPSFIKQGLKYL